MFDWYQIKIKLNQYLSVIVKNIVGKCQKDLSKLVRLMCQMNILSI